MQNFHVCMKTCAEMQAISTFWVQSEANLLRNDETSVTFGLH